MGGELIFGALRTRNGLSCVSTTRNGPVASTGVGGGTMAPSGGGGGNTGEPPGTGTVCAMRMNSKMCWP